MKRNQINHLRKTISWSPYLTANFSFKILNNNSKTSTGMCDIFFFCLTAHRLFSCSLSHWILTTTLFSTLYRWRNQGPAEQLFKVTESLGDSQERRVWSSIYRSSNKPLKVKSEMCQSLSGVRLFTTPRTIARSVPLSMEFSRQEYWSDQPFPSPGIFLIHGSNPGLLHCRRFFTI